MYKLTGGYAFYRVMVKEASKKNRWESKAYTRRVSIFKHTWILFMLLNGRSKPCHRLRMIPSELFSILKDMLI